MTICLKVIKFMLKTKIKQINWTVKNISPRLFLEINNILISLRVQCLTRSLTSIQSIPTMHNTLCIAASLPWIHSSRAFPAPPPICSDYTGRSQKDHRKETLQQDQNRGEK